MKKFERNCEVFKLSKIILCLNLKRQTFGSLEVLCENMNTTFILSTRMRKDQINLFCCCCCCCCCCCSCSYWCCCQSVGRGKNLQQSISSIKWLNMNGTLQKRNIYVSLTFALKFYWMIWVVKTLGSLYPYKLDKICLDIESLNGGLGIRTVWIPRPQCVAQFTVIWYEKSFKSVQHKKLLIKYWWNWLLGICIEWLSGCPQDKKFDVKKLEVLKV